MQTAIREFQFEEGYVLTVTFTDGSRGLFDLSALVSRTGSAIEPLKDAQYFRRGFLEFGALTWPNGFDISPEWLRREMEAAGALQQAAAAE